MSKMAATENIIVMIERELKNGCSTLLDKIINNSQNGINLFAERIEGDPRHMLLTFFWINTNPQPDETLVGKLIDSQQSEEIMKRLDGTDIWYATFKIKNSMSQVAFVERKFAVTSLQYKVKPVNCCAPAYSACI